jgi:hypothetical protein
VVAEKTDGSRRKSWQKPSVVSLAIPACGIAGGHTRGGKQRNFPIRKKARCENDYPAGLKMIANAKAKFDPLLAELYQSDVILPMMRPRADQENGPDAGDSPW